MFEEDIRRALPGTPRHRLADLSAAVWRGFACGAIGEDEAQRLAEEIEARKAVPPAPAQPRRHVGSRPRSSASLERRRAWTASGWLPPTTAASFTMGEQAALGVMMAEIATQGRCALPVEAIAGRAGVCATTVRNGVRQARRLGLVTVEERRVAYDRSLPNVVTIASRELALWVRTRARIERQGGGCKIAKPTTNHYSSSSARPSPAARDRGNRWGKSPGQDLGERPDLRAMAGWNVDRGRQWDRLPRNSLTTPGLKRKLGSAITHGTGGLSGSQIRTDPIGDVP